MIEVEFGGLDWDDRRPVMFNKRGLLHASLPLPPRPWTDEQMLTFEWRTVCGRVHQNVRVAFVPRGAVLPRWCMKCRAALEGKG